MNKVMKNELESLIERTNTKVGVQTICKLLELSTNDVVRLLERKGYLKIVSLDNGQIIKDFDTKKIKAKKIVWGDHNEYKSYLFDGVSAYILMELHLEKVKTIA